MSEHLSTMAARTSAPASTVPRRESWTAERSSGMNDSALTWNCVTFRAWWGFVSCCTRPEIGERSHKERPVVCRPAEKPSEATVKRWIDIIYVGNLFSENGAAKPKFIDGLLSGQFNYTSEICVRPNPVALVTKICKFSHKICYKFAQI